jgi:hypothetical protein
MRARMAFRSSAATRSQSSSDADTALAHSSLILFSLAASITAQSMPRGNPRSMFGLFLKSFVRNLAGFSGEFCAP